MAITAFLTDAFAEVVKAFFAGIGGALGLFVGSNYIIQHWSKLGGFINKAHEKLGGRK